MRNGAPYKCRDFDLIGSGVPPQAEARLGTGWSGPIGRLLSVSGVSPFRARVESTVTPFPAPARFHSSASKEAHWLLD